MRRSFCILLASLASIAQAAVRITPEIAVADPSPAPQEGTQRPEAVASDGTDFLVVWVGLGGLNAGIVKADGKPAGLPRLAIPRTDSMREVSACWTGAVYLVAWGEGTTSDDIEVVAAALARDGTVVSAPRVVAKPAFTRTGALAGNGRRALLAYTRYAGDTQVDVHGALFDVQGALVKADVPLPISFNASTYSDPVPQIASDGNEFALLWRTSEVIPRLMHTFHFARVAEDGTPLGIPITFPQTEQTGGYGLAYGGGKYAVATIEQHLVAIGLGQPRLQRFVVDPKVDTVTPLPSVDTGGFEASVIWNGSQFIAYWMEYSTTSFELLTLPYDASTPVTALQGTRLGHQPRLAFNGRNVFGAWSELVGASERILAARFDASVTALADATTSLISTGWSRQLMPVVATSGRESLMVWVDERGDEDQGPLLAARVALSGAVIDRTPIEIAPEAYMSLKPAVVFTGAAYLVVWSESTTRYGSRTVLARTVGRDGSLGPRVPVDSGYSADVAAASSVTLVVVGGTAQGTVGYRFSPSGERLDTVPIVIASDASAGLVASNGTDFLVAWGVGSDYWQFPSPDMLDVIGKRVTAAGAVDASPISIATGGKDQILKALASDGRDYLVLYHLNFAYTSQSLAAKRVLREGQLDGVTATDDGTVVADLAPGTPSISAAATADPAGGFWVAWLSPRLTLAHTDGRGKPDDFLSTDTLPAGIALAQPPRAPLQIVYSRRATDGPFPMAVRAFLRFFGDIVEPRGRAARH